MKHACNAAMPVACTVDKVISERNLNTEILFRSTSSSVLSIVIIMFF